MIHTSPAVVPPTTGALELVRGTTRLLNVNITGAGAGSTVSFYEGYPTSSQTVNTGTAGFQGGSGNLTHNAANFVPIFTVSGASTGSFPVNIEVQAPLYVSSTATAPTLTIDYT